MSGTANILKSIRQKLKSENFSIEDLMKLLNKLNLTELKTLCQMAGICDNEPDFEKYNNNKKAIIQKYGAMLCEELGCKQ